MYTDTLCWIQMSTTPAGLPDPTYFQGGSMSKAVSSHITVTLPATRQSDKPAKPLRTPTMGNPAVPVADAANSGGARQHTANAGGVSEQGLSFGHSSDPQHQHPAVAQAAVSQTAKAQTSGSSTPHYSAAQASMAQVSATQASVPQASAPQPSINQDSVAQMSTLQLPLFQPQVSGPHAQHRAEESSDVIQAGSILDPGGAPASAFPFEQSHRSAFNESSHLQSQQTGLQGLDQVSPAVSIAPQAQPSYSQGGMTTSTQPAPDGVQPNQTSHVIPSVAAADPRQDSPVRARIQELEHRQS